jgi:hypothetical protein
MAEQEKEREREYIEDVGDYSDVCVGFAQWQSPDGRHILEEDFKVSGKVWRVYKNDVGPFPSNPYAHCVGSDKLFIGCILHLSTTEIFQDRKFLGHKIANGQFTWLIELIRPKFPDLTLLLQG